MFENLTWRNVVVLITALTIAGCLIASGIIIATDPAVRHKAAATQKIHPFKDPAGYGHAWGQSCEEGSNG